MRLNKNDFDEEINYINLPYGSWSTGKEPKENRIAIRDVNF